MTKGKTLGFVGLGSMGSAMAPHLLAAGHEVVAYDASDAARDAFVQAGGAVAGSAAEVSARMNRSSRLERAVN